MKKAAVNRLAALCTAATALIRHQARDVEHCCEGLVNGEPSMAPRWLYAAQGGKPSYYVEGNAVYDTSGKPEFYISDRWLHRYSDGKGAFWISDGWIYEQPGGKPAFYFDE